MASTVYTSPELVPSSFISTCVLHENATLSLELSPKTSAAAAEIRWYKESDCICLYKNGQVRVGTGYVGRLGMLTENFEEGKISLVLRNMTASDAGNYMCEVIYGGRMKCGLRINYSSYTDSFAIYPILGGTYVLDEDMEKMEISAMDLGSQLIPSYDQQICSLGEDAILSCQLFPKTSAVTMEIMWFKGTACIYLYRNGQAREGVGYEGRVSLHLEELTEGKISLTIKGMQPGDAGNYMCHVIHRERNEFALRINYSFFSKEHNFVIYPMTGFSIMDEDREKMKSSAWELEKIFDSDQIQYLTRMVENYQEELKKKDNTIAGLKDELRKSQENNMMLRCDLARFQQQDRNEPYEPHSTGEEVSGSSFTKKRRSSMDGNKPNMAEEPTSVATHCPNSP